MDGALNIDPSREAFLDLSKTLYDNGYHHDTADWQEGWFADMKKDGGVLGFYGPAWLINYTLAPNWRLGLLRSQHWLLLGRHLAAGRQECGRHREG